MTIEQIVGKNVRRIRLEGGISQEVLAYEAGIDRSYFGILEHGERNPTFRLLSRIADLLDCTVVDLVTESHSPLPKNLPRGRKPKKTPIR